MTPPHCPLHALLCLFLAAVLVLSPSCAAGIRPFSLADVQLDNATDFAQGAELSHEYLLLLDPDNLLFNFRTTAGLPAPGQPYGGWEGPAVEVRGQFVGHYLSALAFAYKNTGAPAFLERSAAIVDGLAACQAKWGDGYLAAFPKSFLDRLEALQPVWAPLYVVHKIMAGLLDQHQLVEQPRALGVVTGMADYFCGRFQRVASEKGSAYWQRVLETEFGGMNEVLYNLYMETAVEGYATCAGLFMKQVWFDAMVQGRDTLGGLHANTHLAQINGFAARYDAIGDKDAGVAVVNFFSTLLRGHSFSTGGSNWLEFWHNPLTLGDAVTSLDAGANSEESCTQYNVLKIARTLFRWTGHAALADFYERAVLNGVLGIQRMPHNHAQAHDVSHLHAASHGGTAQPAELPRSGGVPGAPRPVTMTPAEARAVQVTNVLHQGNHTRPANHRFVSWPDDRAAGVRAEVPDHVAPGVFIYYLPLASGLWKGDNGHTWTHGWGDRFNTFWCCYGTAIESFAKLADSIYFHSTADRDVAAAAAPNNATTHSGGHRPTAVPELYINQLVSSTLRWRQLGVTLTQRADLYSGTDNVARSMLRIEVAPPPVPPLDEDLIANVGARSVGAQKDGGSGGGGGGANATFILQWRIPAWAERSRVRLRVNGIAVDVSSLPTSVTGGSAPSGVEFSPPTFGKFSQPALWQFSPPTFGQFNPPTFGLDAAATYVALGPEFTDGSLVEAEMPMRIVIEDLNDARPEMQELKSVVMGPHHMAGLTLDGSNEVDMDPFTIAAAIGLPNDTGLVSLVSSGDPSALLQLQPGGPGKAPAVRFSSLSSFSRADSMHATFRLTSPLVAAGLAGTQQSDDVALVSLESMPLPGQYLAHDGAEGWVLHRHAGVLDSGNNSAARTATFAVRGDLGAALRGTGGAGMPDGASKLALQPLDAPAGQPSSLHLTAPAAAGYPKGARVLQGQAYSYLLVPMGQIIDELYTAYFRFPAAPSAAQAGPLMVRSTWVPASETAVA